MSKYDPKLREAAEEIRAVFKKYDCMGTCAMASPTHSEFVFQPETSWSLLRWEETGIRDKPLGLRFRSMCEDFPNLEAQKEATNSTIHAIESVRWHSALFERDIEKLMNLVRIKMSVMINVAGFMGRPDSIPGDDL